MAKTIGLNITLNGVQTAVSSIRELETELTKARERLSGLEIGTQEFQKLTGEIQRADSQLKNLKKSAEGLESVQQAEAFAKVATGITTSFAAAQAALQLFGAESEDVTAALLKTQQVLTVAVAVRGAAEAALNIKIVANIIAQRAQTLATTQTNIATKALFTTIAANPIGALVTVIGLAVTALIAFSSSSEDAAEEQDKFQEALDRTNRELDLQISLLEKTGGTAVQVAELRLKKEQELEEIASRRFQEENVRNRFSEDREKARLELETQQGKVRLAQLDVENAKKKELEDADKKRDEAQKTRSDKQRERLDKEKQAFLDAYNASIEAVSALRRELEQEVPEPLVIVQLKETLGILEGFSKQVENKPFGELLKEFESLEPPITKSTEELDTFGNTYLGIRKQLSQAAQQGAGFKEVGESILREFGQLRSAGLITQEAFNSLTQIVDSYNSISKIVQKDLTGEQVSEYYKKLQENLVATGEIILKVGADGKAVQQELTVGTVEALQGFDNYTKDLEKILKDTYLKDAEVLKLAESERESAAKKMAQARLATLKAESLEIIEQEQNIIKFRKEADDLRIKREKITNSAVLGFFKQNADKFIQEYAEIYGDDIDGILKEFQTSVELSLVEGTTLTDEQLQQQDALFKEFYEKLKKYREENNADEEAEAQKRKERLDAYISGASSSLSQLNGILRGFAQESLNALERENEQTLSNIVGTSEEANQKRLEQEAIYNEKKKEIEKRAALTELNLTLFQAIADGAAAVIATAARTPALVPVVVALNLAQIGLINSQIQTTRSLQRGGLLAGGGLLEGPSHENGGIRMAQAGVVAEGGEAVINRVSSVQYRDLLSNINQAGGGAPLVVSSFDDSRLLEALAKQRKEPIRAYVQEQEITNKQAISRRLERLSSL